MIKLERQFYRLEELGWFDNNVWLLNKNKNAYCRFVRYSQRKDPGLASRVLPISKSGRDPTRVCMETSNVS